MQTNGRKLVMMCADRRIDRRVLDQARSLNRHGWQTTVIASPCDDRNENFDEQCYPDIAIVRYDAERTTELMQQIDMEKLSQIISCFSDFRWDKIWTHFLHFLVEAVSKPAQVYTAHDLPMLPFAAYAAAYHGAYMVYDSHELYPYQRNYSFSKTFTYYQIENEFIPSADQVITVSPSFADQMQKSYPIELPEVIRNCPAFEGSQLPIPRSRLIHDSLKIPYDKKILLYQGAIIGGVRSLETVIAAMPHVKNPNIAYVLMGPDSGSLEEFQHFAQELGVLNSRVYFHEPVPQEVLLKYSASADAGIIPYPPIDLNTYYCNPNKMFEFMVAGLPIFANSIPEVRSFVDGQGIGLTVEMNSPEAIAQGIDDFFAKDQEALRRRVAEISKNHIWETQVPRLVSIYNSLLAEQRVPRSFLRAELRGMERSAVRNEAQDSLMRLHRLGQILEKTAQMARPHSQANPTSATHC